MSVQKLQRWLVVVLLGLGAALLAADLLFNGQEDAPENATALNSYTVVRAVNLVPRGSIIRPQDVEASASSEDHIAGVAMRPQEAAGRVAVKDIAPNEAITSANTTSAPREVGLAQLIPAGLRAVAVNVADDLAVANLIRPGDRVDVLVISNAARAARGTEPTFPNAEVRTVLQNIRVLAVGETIVGTAQNAKNYRTVTLAVTPREAGMIALARSVGTQYLSLRAADDMSQSDEAASLTTDDLRYEAQSTEETASSGSASRVVEIIEGSGAQRQTTTVPQGAP